MQPPDDDPFVRGRSRYHVERSAGEWSPRDVVDRAHVIFELALGAILKELLIALNSGQPVEEKLRILRVHIYIADRVSPRLPLAH